MLWWPPGSTLACVSIRPRRSVSWWSLIVCLILLFITVTCDTVLARPNETTANTTATITLIDFIRLLYRALYACVAYGSSFNPNKYATFMVAEVCSATSVALGA